MAKQNLPPLNKHGKKKPDILLSRLKELLSYNKETGKFYWARSNRIVKAGDEAGGLISIGYLTVSLDGRRYYLHRLAWLFETGKMPVNQIDHINGIKYDNRFCNLRHVTQEQNQRNVPKHKDRLSKFKGVSFIKISKPWKAQVYINGKNASKDFCTEEEAALWHDEQQRKHFGEYATLNFPREGERQA